MSQKTPPEPPGGGDAPPAPDPSPPQGTGPDASVAPVKKKKKKKGKFGSDRGIETMFRTSYRTHLELSALADTKANIMISINGIVMSIILASISPKIDANPWLVMPTSVLLIGCMASMVFAILAARPRVSSQVVTLEDVRANRKNVLFFGNFVHLTEDDFVVGMSELLLNTEQLYVNMMRDLYSLGGVLNRKFALLRTSYTIFMWALMVGVTLYIGVFISVVAGDTSAAVLP